MSDGDTVMNTHQQPATSLSLGASQIEKLDEIIAELKDLNLNTQGSDVKPIVVMYVDVMSIAPQDVATYIKDAQRTIWHSSPHYHEVIHYFVPVRTGTGTKVEVFMPNSCCNSNHKNSEQTIDDYYDSREEIRRAFRETLAANKAVNGGEIDGTDAVVSELANKSDRLKTLAYSNESVSFDQAGHKVPDSLVLKLKELEEGKTISLQIKEDEVSQINKKLDRLIEKTACAYCGDIVGHKSWCNIEIKNRNQ